MPRSQGEELSSAARALADALSDLSKAVGRDLAETSQGAGAQLASTLRDASRQLADASAEVSRRNTGIERRRVKAERTRAQLLEAARKLFAQRGFEGASVGDVAAEAGFTKGALYSNFGDKEDLLFQLADELAAKKTDPDDVRRFVAALSDPVTDPDCRATPEDTAEDTTSPMSRALMILEIYAYAARHPEARRRLAPVLVAGWDEIARVWAALREPDTTGARPAADADVSVADRDTAFVLLSAQVMAPLFDAVLGDDRASAAMWRFTERLRDEDDD